MFKQHFLLERDVFAIIMYMKDPLKDSTVKFLSYTYDLVGKKKIYINMYIYIND